MKNKPMQTVVILIIDNLRSVSNDLNPLYEMRLANSSTRLGSV